MAQREGSGGYGNERTGDERKKRGKRNTKKLHKRNGGDATTTK